MDASTAAVRQAVRQAGGVVLAPGRSPPPLRQHLALLAQLCCCTHLVGLGRCRAAKTAPTLRFRHWLRMPQQLEPPWSVGWDAASRTLLRREGRRWVPLPLAQVGVTVGW